MNQWKEKIPFVWEVYSLEDIFNMDESGLFVKDSTKSTYFQAGETCAGGKWPKQRIIVAFCASMLEPGTRGLYNVLVNHDSLSTHLKKEVQKHKLIFHWLVKKALLVGTRKQILLKDTHLILPVLKHIDNIL